MKTKTQSFGKPLCRVMMAVAIMLLSLQAMAYDFSYTYQGKTLYYEILAGGTNEVRLTYYNLDGSDTANNHVSGDVVIPSSVEYNGTTYRVTSIGDGVFDYCSGLTSVTIPNSVTSIGDGAFYACSGLTSITIPNSVTSIGRHAFDYCSGLTSIDVASENTHYSSTDGVLYNYAQDTLILCPKAKTSVTIPNSVTFIRAWAFYGCSGLTSVIIGNSVTYIGMSAFYDCSSLASINVASGNTHYSSTDGVLYNYAQDTLILCPEAKSSVNIPSSVTFIGAWAFYACSGLTSIKCLASIPPSIGNNSFQNISDTCLLTVPCGSLEAYTTSDWNTYFAARIIEEPLFELSVSANDEAYGRVEVENHSCESKTLTAIANNGYVFSRWNDGNTENPRTVTVTSDTAFMAIFTEAVSTPTITLTVNNEAMGSASYTLDGNTAVLTATANEGYSFLTWSDGNTENPRTVTITSDTTFMAIFSPASSLQDVDTKEFSLYPNPAKGFVVLEFETLQGNTPLQIFDMNGRTLRSFDLKAGREVLKIDLEDLPKGVYAIKFGNAIRKLVVE